MNITHLTEGDKLYIVRVESLWYTMHTNILHRQKHMTYIAIHLQHKYVSTVLY